MKPEIRKKILDMVHSRPRAIAEIALEIQKNWRTADRYVESLVSEDLIKLHVFRKGGRGALKVAYWPTSLTENPSATKNFLLNNIVNSKRREDFSPMDILQHVPEKKRKVEHLSEKFYNSGGNVEEFFKAIKDAKERILFFSGNLTFTKMGNRYKDQIDLLESKVKQGVNLFFLMRVDITNKEIIRDILAINRKGHKGKIEMRYCFQPLRCTLVDDKVFYIKERFEQYSEGVKKDKWTWTKGEYIYTITDSEWVNWMTDVFWHLWHGSINAKQRLDVFEEVIEKQ